MCIRDRVNDDGQIEAYHIRSTYPFELGSTTTTWARVQAVSYTHLDVYKRQAMPCDPAPVYYKAAPGGKDKIVTTRGEVVSCEIVPGANATDAGYRPHWATLSLIHI